MNLTDELRKLAELHQAGHLTDEEFAEAKRKIIAESRAHQIPDAEDVRPAAVEGEDAIDDVDPEERTYQSSRWSSGNLFFPDRLTLSRDGILFQKRAMFGSREERISYRAIASIRVTNGMFLSDISVETSGGSQPIYMNGLWKSDARDIQATIRAFQQSA